MSITPYVAAKSLMNVRQKLQEINWALVVLITTIACVGFAVLYSAAGGNLSPWADRQMLRFAVGFIVMIAVACIDIRVWMGLAYPAYAVSLVLLILVDAMGRMGLGAQRWLELGPLQLQPSELMKITMILALARLLHGLDPGDISRPLRLLAALALICVPAVLVLMEPNLGTAAIIGMTGFLLLFVGGLSWWWIAPAFAAIGAAIPYAWQHLHGYQKQRILTFLNPESDLQGAGWNITQAKIALGSGGVSGKGFLQGTQSRLNFLPEKETDFIFTIIGEEFGFLGACAVLVLLGTVIYFGISIAVASKSHFGRILALGITINFFLYIMINGLMVMGLIPVVGIPMPLISYGGTAMMTVMFGFGLLLCVHVHRHVEVPRRASGMM